MTTRVHFDRKLDELRDSILMMGSRVHAELELALRAYRNLDLELAAQVYAADQEVNQTRFEIEEECFTLIVTQQPAARDLRAIVTAMNVIVDLERMGDQAKGIAKVIPHLLKNPAQTRPDELLAMAEEVADMLQQVMVSYGNSNVDLARVVAQQDDKVDLLYNRVFIQIMNQMAATGNADKVEAAYELLRVARELERFGDLATNIAERTIYLVTGSFDEVNVDHDED
jgi:phosphate transport system protein